MGLGLKQTYHLLWKDKYVVHFEHFPIFNRRLGKETRLSFEMVVSQGQRNGIEKSGGQQEARIRAPPFPDI